MGKLTAAVIAGLAAWPATTLAADVKIGFITKFPAGFYTVMMDEAKKTADASGAEIIFGQAKSQTDNEGQTAIIESMITQGVNGIAIAPIDPAVAPALDEAIAAGIKVVLVDNDLPDWKGKSSFVGTDNFNGGVIAGEYLKTRLKDGDKVGILAGSAGVPALDARVNGMLQGLGDVKVNVVATLPTGCTRELGVSAMEDILSANPDVVAIYAACAPPLMGAIQTLDNKGIEPGKVIMVGFDALPEEITEIENGREEATVAQFPTKIGALGVETLLKAIKGESVSAVVDTGTGLVTKANAADFK